MITKFAFSILLKDHWGVLSLTVFNEVGCLLFLDALKRKAIILFLNSTKPWFLGCFGGDRSGASFARQNQQKIRRNLWKDTQPTEIVSVHGIIISTKLWVPPRDRTWGLKDLDGTLFVNKILAPPHEINPSSNCLLSFNGFTLKENRSSNVLVQLDWMQIPPIQWQ